MVVSRNEHVAAASFLSLHVENNEDYEKQDMVANIEFEARDNSIKKCLFHKRMVDFVNKLEFSHQKY